MAWNKDVPAAGIQARYLDDGVRTNNAAIDAVFGDMLDAGAAVTASAAEINGTCDGNTATAAELSQLHSQGAVAADFAKLHAVTASATELNQCDNKTLVNTTDAQNIAGPKVFTDGLTVQGGALKIAPSSGVVAQITGKTSTETTTAIYAGGYTSGISSAVIHVRSKDHATVPGTISLYGSNGSGTYEALVVDTDGTVNLPVGLEIGGVAVPYSVTSFAPGGDFSSGTIYVTKIGRSITMTWGSMSHSSGYSAAAGNKLGAAYRPPISIIIPVYMTTTHVTTLSVLSDGSISFVHRDWAGSVYTAIQVVGGSASWVSDS